MSYNHDHENEVNYFAKTNFRNQMTKFGIKTDDRRRHVYVIGKTGMGKTTLLENFILSDIYAGHGCCYVDPHGDTAEKLINYIPSWRLNDVVYFNPADMDYPVGFNILEAVSERHKHLVASGMMGVFQKIWENMWSSRMEYILNNTILALLDNPGQTLLGINRMLSDADFRKRIIGNVKDPVVRQFWLKEFASYNDKYAQEAVAPIQNKIGQFLSATVIRNIVAQVKSSINVREIMDSEKIFIINLSKGRIGEDNSRLLGGLLITKIQLSAMERVDTPEKERKDFYLYVDEFQNFAVESFASILSEARKYRLCLTMAHQYIAQLTEEVRDAVFGNVGTIITFRVGSPDAVFMEAEFMPRFTPEDIINLPKFNVYLKLLIEGVTSQPFSAMTLSPIAQVTHSEEKVIKISRERYAKPRAEIEEKILQWSGMENTDMETLLKEAEQKKKDQKESKKPRFEYKCSRCGKDVVLPVELDRSRPIYCDDCIAIVRDERKTGKKPFVKPPFPPKPSEGQSVEKLPEEPSITLSTLRKPSISAPVSVPKSVVVPSRTPAPATPAPATPAPATPAPATPAPATPAPATPAPATPAPATPAPAQRSSVASHSYTCSDCTRTFSAGVKLDPSRSLYCQECLEKIRAKRKEHPVEKKQEANHPRLVTSSVVQSSLSQQTDDVTKKKRKRKRKNKQTETVPSVHTESMSPKKPEPPQEKLGTLKTGQTVHFD
ncbi:type IV secretion system DNA-binding domain-containing protein [Candidatus Uhrbacteria bacterium]|nr:type IV secretion system DNA-binding domain-containing protein [Candidatus Uhrbacteria bacterium]